MNFSADKLLHRIEALHEFNPMLGFRGCRLAVSYPEIADAGRAIFEAAVRGGPQERQAVVLEIMVPLVSLSEELRQAVIDSVAKRSWANHEESNTWSAR